MAFPTVEPIVQFMKAVTGWDITNDKLLETGERISTLRQAFNVREGLNPLQFRVPGRVIGKLSDKAVLEM